jgi:hypothetical protein
VKFIYAAIFISLIPLSSHAVSNNVMLDCKPDNPANYNKWAACINTIESQRIKKEQAELRDFLILNPRYRYPGQSLNKCFSNGKARGIAKVIKTDSSITVYYKPKVDLCY